jgi:hypothetical protein
VIVSTARTVRDVTLRVQTRARRETNYAARQTLSVTRAQGSNTAPEAPVPRGPSAYTRHGSHHVAASMLRKDAKAQLPACQFPEVLAGHEHDIEPTSNGAKV